MYVIFFALNVIITAISSTFILYGKASSSLNFEGRFLAVPTILSAMSGAFFIVHCEASGYSMLWAYGVTVSIIYLLTGIPIVYLATSVKSGKASGYSVNEGEKEKSSSSM